MSTTPPPRPIPLEAAPHLSENAYSPGSPPAGVKAPPDPFLVRLRWKLPFAILLLVLGLLGAFCVYYATLFQFLKKRYNEGDDVVPHMTLALVCLVVQLIFTSVFLVSFYWIVFSDPGHVPRNPWRRQPWFINRRLCSDGIPLNRLSDIEQYHNDENNVIMQRIRSAPLPSTVVPLPPSEDDDPSLLAECRYEYVIPDNYSPVYDDWRREMERQGVHLTSLASPHSRRDDETEEDSGMACSKHNPLLSPAESSEPHLGNSHTTCGHPRCPFQHVDQCKVNPYFVTLKEPSGDYRYCAMCRIYKPDMAYHCKVCAHCVYNFDHHCPYVDNCIGRNNYKIFISFLIHATWSTFLGFVLMIVTIAAADRREAKQKWPWAAVGVVSLFIFAFMFRFLVKHIRYICTGRTTMELIIQKRRVASAKKKDLPIPEDPVQLMPDAMREAKRRVHQEVLFGPPRWNRWLSLLSPVAHRTDDRPTELSPIVYLAPETTIN